MTQDRVQERKRSFDKLRDRKAHSSSQRAHDRRNHHTDARGELERETAEHEGADHQQENNQFWLHICKTPCLFIRGRFSYLNAFSSVLPTSEMLSQTSIGMPLL